MHFYRVFRTLLSRDYVSLFGCEWTSPRLTSYGVIVNGWGRRMKPDSLPDTLRSGGQCPDEKLATRQNSKSPPPEGKETICPFGLRGCDRLIHYIFNTLQTLLQHSDKIAVPAKVVLTLCISFLIDNVHKGVFCFYYLDAPQEWSVSNHSKRRCEEVVAPH